MESFRVCFDFAGEKQIQYATQLPCVGDLVAHIGALWVVEKVDEDYVGAVVTCTPPSPVLQRPADRLVGTTEQSYAWGNRERKGEER